MKKYPSTISSDYKGQLVIPKEVRKELSIEEGAAFWIFLIENEGILLKRVSGEHLSENELIMVELRENSDKITVNKSNIDRSIERYRRKKITSLEEI